MTGKMIMIGGGLCIAGGSCLYEGDIMGAFGLFMAGLGLLAYFSKK